MRFDSVLWVYYKTAGFLLCISPQDVQLFVLPAQSPSFLYAKVCNSYAPPRKALTRLLPIEMHNHFKIRDVSKETRLNHAFQWRLFVSQNHCAFLQLHRRHKPVHTGK